MHRIGQTLAASKARRNHKTQNLIADPITVLNRGLNLLGDPEMSIWTKSPADLAVKVPKEIPLGESEVEVKVYSGTEPLREARVCIWKEGEHHVSALTDKDGLARLLVRARFPGQALFTVTAHNHMPFEASFRCGGGGPP